LKRALPIGEKLVAEFPLTVRYAEHLSTLLHNWADLLRNTDRLKEAETAYRRSLTVQEKLVKDAPQRPDFRRGLATTYSSLGTLLSGDAARLNDADDAYQRALAIREELAKQSPQSGEDQSGLAAIQNNLALLHRQRGQLAEARKLFEQAIIRQQSALRSNPKNVKYRSFLRNHYWKLAETLVEQGEHGPAISFFQEALGLTPDDPDVLNGLAWLLATCPEPGFRDSQRAVELAQKAVAGAPEVAGLHNTLGIAQYRAGKWQDAIASLERSITLAGHADGYDLFFLAMSRWQIGERDQARNDFAAAVDWTDKNKANDEELKRFRTEAEALPGIKTEPAAKPPMK
jgi:tetratricopeptide (TPR) repeat protein